MKIYGALARAYALEAGDPDWMFVKELEIQDEADEDETASILE